ncbi:MAG: hypothetical protein SPL08_01340 [Pseudomonadota bacterium]|nr:hypothetical protein [Pseudomonadota bacterium]
MTNLNEKVLDIVPENNPILNDINALSDDVRKLVKIFSESFSYPWQESKERARELNKVWLAVFKNDQLKSSLTVNQYAAQLPLHINCNLRTLSMFFGQLQNNDRIEPYLYATICDELKIPGKKANRPKEALFQLYLDKIACVTLHQLLDYHIWQKERKNIC